jgi:hypothetical protein
MQELGSAEIGSTHVGPPSLSDNNFGRFRRCFGQLQNADYIFQAVVPGESTHSRKAYA